MRKVFLYNPGNFSEEEFHGVWPNNKSQFIEWTREPQDVAVWIDSDGQHYPDGNGNWDLPTLENKYKEVNAKLNIYVLYEPENLCPANYQWLIKNKDKFDAIFTYYPDFGDGSDKFVYYKGFGRTYILPENRKIYEKTKNVAAVFSDRVGGMPGYNIRWALRTAPYRTLIDFNNPTVGSDKYLGTKDYRYEVVVKNEDYPSFQEKLNDALLVGAIPIYWSSQKEYLEDVFDLDGFFFFKDEIELGRMFLENKFTAEHYESKKEAIEHNFKVAQTYTSLGDVLWRQGIKRLIDENNL